MLNYQYNPVMGFVQWKSEGAIPNLGAPDYNWICWGGKPGRGKAGKQERRFHASRFLKTFPARQFGKFTASQRLSFFDTLVSDMGDADGDVVISTALVG